MPQPAADDKQYPQHQGELFARITPEMTAIFERSARSFGGWRRLCWVLRCSGRQMRKFRAAARGEEPVMIGMALLDRWLTRLDLGDWLNDFEWFTVDELVECGIWNRMIDVATVESRKKRRT